MATLNALTNVSRSVAAAMEQLQQSQVVSNALKTLTTLAEDTPATPSSSATPRFVSMEQGGGDAMHDALYSSEDLELRRLQVHCSPLRRLAAFPQTLRRRRRGPSSSLHQSNQRSSYRSCQHSVLGTQHIISLPFDPL